jgi:hypothetical protein
MKTLKFYHIIITSLFLIGLLGCSKKSTTVDVIVLEKGTNKPAAGIPVNFGYSSSGGVFAGQVVEQTKTTDANGRVSFKGENKNKSYSVGFPYGADYFGDGATLKEGHNGIIGLYIYPFAYVRVHAKNVSPFDNNDWIDITNGLLGGGGAGLYGASVDTILIRGPFKGTENGGFGWVVEKNNIITTTYIELYYIGRDTIDYTINY